jgi:hypothetical protein
MTSRFTTFGQKQRYQSENVNRGTERSSLERNRSQLCRHVTVLPTKLQMVFVYSQIDTVGSQTSHALVDFVMLCILRDG